MKSRGINTIVLTGIVGMIGAFLGVVSDIILLGRPTSGLEALLSGARDNTMYVDQWRLPVGSMLGAMAIPVAIVGFWHVRYALRPAGKGWSWSPFLILAHMLCVGAAFHGSYMFVGTALKANLALVQAGGSGMPEMVARLGLYSNLLLYVSAVELVIGSILFVWAVLKHPTLYPRWMAITNPAICGGALYAVALLFPAPVGGYVGVVGFNFGALVFLLISTLVLRGAAEKSTGEPN